MSVRQSLDKLNRCITTLPENPLSARLSATHGPARISMDPGGQPKRTPPPETKLANLILQCDRGLAAGELANQLGKTAQGNDETVLKTMGTTVATWRHLRETARTLRPETPEPQTLAELTEDASVLAHANDQMMCRLKYHTVMRLIEALHTRARGEFEAHELYAVARLLSASGEDLGAHPVQEVIAKAQASNNKARVKSSREAGQRISGSPSTDPLASMSEPQRQTVHNFAMLPIVRDTLLEHAELRRQEFKGLFEGYQLREAFSDLSSFTMEGNPTAYKILDNANIEFDKLCFQAGVTVMYEYQSDPVKFSKYDSRYKPIAEAYKKQHSILAETFLEPSEHARYIEDHPLIRGLQLRFSHDAIASMSDIVGTGKAFLIPEDLIVALRALKEAARPKKMGDALTTQIGAASRAVKRLVNDVRDSNSLAVELSFVLDKKQQNAMRELHDSVKKLTSAVEGKPNKSKPKPRKNGPRPGDVAAAAPQPETTGLAMFDPDENDVDAEEETPTSLAHAPNMSTVAQVSQSATGPSAPMRSVEVRGRPTSLKTRLSNEDALALIQQRMHPGSFKNPLQSAIYHYNKHVLRKYEANAEPYALSIEDYIMKGLARENDWNHLVTRSRTDSNELLRVVDAQPKAYLTFPDQAGEVRLVSFCYSEP